MSTTMTQPRPVIMTSASSEWSSGICDCTQDLPQCCLAFWCLPCFACKTSYEAGECVCLPLLNITTPMRVSIRQRYGIEGTVCNDWVHSCFCTPCTWCQMAREMKARKSPVTFISMSS
ncbi:cornifelin homolog B-like [Centropristis striata]|uniref:cornifelin homolog B-like n=1 Tax=Centropristis striata TaxID=184440 RepID=UPI0027E04481|nr:cornifelin homolog B-like [Centropristis striata]